MVELTSYTPDAKDTHLAALLLDPYNLDACRKLLIQNGEVPDAVNDMRVLRGQMIMPYSYRIHGKVDPDGEYERLFENEDLVVAVDSSRWDVISRGSDGTVAIARRFVRVDIYLAAVRGTAGRAYTTAKLQKLEKRAKQVSVDK